MRSKCGEEEEENEEENDEDEDDVESRLVGRIKFLAPAGRTGRLASPSMDGSHRHFYGDKRAKWEISKEGGMAGRYSTGDLVFRV